MQASLFICDVRDHSTCTALFFANDLQSNVNYLQLLYYQFVK